MMLQIDESVTGPINTPAWAIEGVHAARVREWVCEMVKGDGYVPWRRCWDLLSRAVNRYPGEDGWTEIELLRAITRGDCQLWIAWSYERHRIEGAVVTRILVNPPLAPNETVLEGSLVGGSNMAAWGPGMMGLLRAWALAQGCSYIGGPGRKGWMRALGFHEVGKTPEGFPVLAMPLKKH